MNVAPVQRGTTMPGGFTLPGVMVVAAAVLTLAVGLLLVVGIERRTARSQVERQRAELAARAGMEELRSVLLEQASNDGFLVIEHRGKEGSGGGLQPQSHLYLVAGSAEEGEIRYDYHPLFSANSAPAGGTELEAPDPVPLVGDEDAAPIDALPWQQPAQVAWIPVKDREGRVVARYAYWVEDLQARLNGETAGNQLGEDGTHMRNAYPFPAPGLNPDPASGPALDRVALHALDPESGAEDASELDDRLIEGRGALVTPESVLAAAKFEAPFERGDDGRLTDPGARALEENVAATVQAYLEQPLVPWIEGIDPQVAGQPRKNLNRLLAMERDEAVDEMAGWVQKALPEFAQRRGGFPDDYLRTLAANALDYADDDGDASVRDGVYRGLDSYPLVSEFVMRFRWENIVKEGGRKYAVISVTTYIELWNMSDQAVEGKAQLTYETAMSFPFGVFPSPPGIMLTDPDLLDDPAVVTPTLEKRGGNYWFSPLSVRLKPNEYRVYQAGRVIYKLDTGPESDGIPEPLELGGDDGLSGYRMEWNGRLVDQARGNIQRHDPPLYYRDGPQQKVRASVPGHSYQKTLNPFRNNMGDPRIAFYNQGNQAANEYPGNYSPNRRNIRWSTIYNKDAATKPKVYGRVLPSEWPDGGHDSEFGSGNFVTTNANINPDDPKFFSGVPAPKREEAPMRISNDGRFFSVTELGRVYDPIMWNTGAPPAAGMPWPDVIEKDKVTASGDFGGGNTLRIGRPEHPRFDKPGLRAAQWLDLFHAGESRAEDPELRQGGTVRIHGQVNVNTATRDALRAMAAGILRADPALARVVSNSHDTGRKMAQPTTPWEISAPTSELEADVIADAVIRSRPFASASELALALDEQDRPVFGNRDQYSGGSRIQWTDPAAEEVFARVFEAATVRSRNFRLWVVGQSVGPVGASSGQPPVLAESRLVFNLFSDPGERGPDGSLAGENHRVRIIHENTY